VSPPPIPPTSPAPTSSTTTSAKTTAPPPTPSTQPALPDLARVRVTPKPVASGLDSPIVAWRVHDTNMFVAEQGGRVRIVDPNGRLSPTPVLTVGPLSSNEEGLLGITFSPDGSKL
jgi:glucose/arabinose dehydrogenase